MKQEKVKITVSLPQETVNDIKILADKLGTTASDLLRRAVRTEKFLDEIESQNGKLLIETEDSQIQRIIRR